MYNNEYYGSTNDYRNYISHHGIKGQKWGVKHGPPYPLEKATSKGIIKRWGDYQKKIDKEREEKVHKLAKKIYKKGPLKKLENYRHDQENKNIEKTYSWNKQSSKKQQHLVTQQHIQNHQQMMRMHNDITQQHIHQAYHTMMFGKDTPKEDVKEPLDTSKMTEWEKKTIKGGYVVNNPSGFEEGTTFTHRDYKSFSSDTWEIDDADTRIVIDRTVWDKDVTDPLDKIYKNKKLKPKEASKKDLISLQKSLIKNNSKIVNDVIDSIADNIASESNNDWFPKEHKGKSKSDFAEMIKNDMGASIRAVAAKVPNGDGYTIEVTVGDGYIYNGHILTKEVYFDPTTGKYRILTPGGYQMDG